MFGCLIESISTPFQKRILVFKWIYSKTDFVCVHILMNVNTCTDSGHHNQNQNTEQLHHPKKRLHVIFLRVHPPHLAQT